MSAVMTTLTVASLGMMTLVTVMVVVTAVMVVCQW